MKFGNLLGQLRSCANGLLAITRFFVRGRRHGGAVGVVIDLHGAVLGTYCDPFTDPLRPPRLHTAGSPWVGAGEWAWEGFGGTQQEALARADRLRRRHLRLIPAMLDDGTGPHFRANTPR